MTSRIFAASATLRQIGPVRMFSPAPIMPSRLTSSCVGASPTRLFTAAGHRIDTTVSSPIAQVTRLAATELAEPALGVVRVAKGTAERTARTVHGVLRQVRLRQDDRARVTQSPNERRVVGRTIVGVLRVGARRRAHVEGVVLVFDGHDDTMEWA